MGKRQDSFILSKSMVTDDPPGVSARSTTRYGGDDKTRKPPESNTLTSNMDDFLSTPKSTSKTREKAPPFSSTAWNEMAQPLRELNQRNVSSGDRSDTLGTYGVASSQASYSMNKPGTAASHKRLVTGAGEEFPWNQERPMAARPRRPGTAVEAGLMENDKKINKVFVATVLYTY